MDVRRFADDDLAELGRFVLQVESQPPSGRSDLQRAAVALVAEWLALSEASGSTGETGS